ncbi:MAG: hypothetical protein Kow0029_31520 [Candidatus Rifleibacteriota bacterium]
MSNSIAVQTLNPVLENDLVNKEVDTNVPAVRKTQVKVVPPNPSEPPTLEMLMQLYAAQERECWLCEGIAKKVAAGKVISEDDNWHFTSCVLSWEYLHSHNE